MMLLLKKRLSCTLIPCIHGVNSITTTMILNPCPQAHLPQCYLLFSTKPSSQGPSSPNPHFMVAYLIDQLGFSQERAAKASKRLTHLKSTEKPDSVLRFLDNHGLTKAQITAAIARYPQLLCARLSKSLQPNMKALLDMGLPRPLLAQLVAASPRALELHTAAPRITFWRTFFEGDDEKLLKALKRTRGLIGHDINTSIAPKISLLRKLGFSASVIQRMIFLIPQFITNGLGTIEAQVKRTEQLGFARDSGMFVYGLFAVANLSREMLDKKMELLRSFGWSEQDLLLALFRVPNMMLLSEKLIRMKMEFLIWKVGYEASYLASHPMLMILSLDKRLMPRYHVIQELKMKGLACDTRSIFSAMMLTEEKFMMRYLLPYEDEIPELREDYIAACDGRRMDLSMDK